MKRNLLLAMSLIAASFTAPAASPTSGRNNSAEAFARLKTLAGEWEATTGQGKMHLSIEPIAAGTALVERETAENMPPMLTVYYLDGGRLLLTHYCMTGNQPRMQEKAFNPETGDVEFAFLDATNLASPAAVHMHNARFHLADHDRFVTEWDLYENGARKTTEKLEYTRVGGK